MQLLIAILFVSYGVLSSGVTLNRFSVLSARAWQKDRQHGLIEVDVIAINPPFPSKTLIQTVGPVLCAAFTAAALMYPLDLIRALKMANAANQKKTAVLLQNFAKIHGVQGFFTQGLAPELARSTWMRFIKFGLFPIVHKAISGTSEAQGTALTRVVAAAITSVPEAISIMPLEISKIALQLDKTNVYKNNMFAAMNSVRKTQGLRGFRVGYWGVQYRQAAWSAAYFATIPFFKKVTEDAIEKVGGGYFENAHPERTQTFATVMSGFFAGVFGAAINTPADTIRSTIQKRVLMGKVDKAVTLIGVGKEIVASNGVGGLYAGFKFKALHLGGGGALMAILIPFYQNVFNPPPPVIEEKQELYRV